MVNMTEEKISEKKYFSLGSFVDDEVRGIIFSGKTGMDRGNGGQYLSDRLSGPETVLVQEGRVMSGVGGFQFIDGVIYWQERDDRSEVKWLHSEEGLKVPQWYIHPLQIIDGKKVLVKLNGKKNQQTLWVDGIEGPMCEAIHDITLTSQGIGYTAFTEEGMDVMLNNERYGKWRGSHKLFEHQGKLGCIISRRHEKGFNYEGVVYGDEPYGNLGLEFWVHSLSGKLVTVAREGYLFQSGTTNVPLLGGEIPTYDLSSDYGHVIFIDGERFEKASGPTFEEVEGGFAMALKSNNKIGDDNPENHKTRIVIMRDGQPTIDYTVQGEGYLHNIGGKPVFSVEYYTGEEGKKLYVEDRLIAERPHMDHSIVDIDGQIGGMVSVEKDKGLFPAINGNPAGEQIPLGYHSYAHLHSRPFAGNVVVSTGNIFRPESHLVVGGQVFGPYIAASDPVHKAETLEFIAAKEDGTYLLTFRK